MIKRIFAISAIGLLLMAGPASADPFGGKPPLVPGMGGGCDPCGPASAAGAMLAAGFVTFGQFVIWANANGIDPWKHMFPVVDRTYPGKTPEYIGTGNVEIIRASSDYPSGNQKAYGSL